MSNNPPLGTLVRVDDVTKMDRYVYPPTVKNSIGIYIGNGEIMTSAGRKFATGAIMTPVKEGVKKARMSIYDYARGTFDGQLTRSQKWQTGSDPEIFALDGEGKVLPAFKFLPGKHEVGNAHSTPYYDGFQAEWTVKPQRCHSYTVDNIQTGLRNTLIAAQKLDPKASLTWKPVLEIPNEMLESLDEKFVALGCAPSKNGYINNESALRGISGRNLLIRFAGMHMHFEIKDLTRIMAKHVVKQIDRVVGVYFVAALAGMDDAVRRKFYGRAGEYRLPSHGLEYRVLSSAALAHPALTHLAFDLGRAVVQYAVGGIELIQGEDTMFQECINDCNVDLAKELIGKNRSFYTKFLQSIYDNAKALVLSDQGAMNILPISSMDDNWKFTKGWNGHSDGRNENSANTLRSLNL